jgi:hypothetical protein
MSTVKIDLNKETNEWLCWIPDTGYGWYIKGKRNAHGFCNELNEKFDKGVIRLNPNTGKLEKVN